MRRLISLLICLFVIPLAIACGDDDGDDTQNNWDIGENQTHSECFDEDKYDAPIEDCPIACPLAEGYSYVEDDCGCACEYSEPDPPISCPDEDDGYRYVSDDPDECMVIEFPCEGHQEHFNNECGCGCRDVDGPPPPPVECDEEDGYTYDYVNDDPDECQDAIIDCFDEESMSFENNCGCGCKHPIDDPPPPGEPVCEAQDASEGGFCRADIFYGYAYDGRTCSRISGCECVGDDCDDLYASRDDCEQAYDDECFADACEPMDIAGEGPCDAILGYGYAGQEHGCVPVGGCDCVGDDCDLLYGDPGTCEDDHRHC